MPFITEELYQKLPKTTTKKESITIASYPLDIPSWKNKEIETIFEELFNFVKITRSLISSVNIPNSIKPKVYVVFSGDLSSKANFENNKKLITDLARISEVKILLIQYL